MNRFIAMIFLLITFLLLFPIYTNAQIVINEVSPASDAEWVEIFNTSSSSASLKGYSINFGTDSQNKFFCDGEAINENSYKIVNLTAHWLADSGDIVTLRNGDDVVDSVGYGSGHTLGKPSGTGSISRSPDGNSNWVLASTSSRQGDLFLFDCPTPVPTPTPQPTVFSTSTPTPVPAPTKTPTPVPTPTKTPTPKPTPTPEILGEASGSGMVVTSPTPDTEIDDSDNKFPFIAIIFVGSGVILIGIAIYLMNARKNNPQT